MADEQYYRLELDDYSAPSFCSFGKNYFGTMEEIRASINRLNRERPESHRELVLAFRAFEAGQREVNHHVAYQQVPLLTPARLIHRESLVLENNAWDHLNTWGCIYKMHCDRVETEHLWIECEGHGFRVMKATFKELHYEGALGGWTEIGEGMLWGFPCMLVEDSGNFRNVLAVREKIFKTMEKLEEDWEAFRENPDPQFSGFCEDIFGNG